MKKITARFNSKCAETGAAIRKGQEMIYDYGTRKCYSMQSPTGAKFIADVEANRESDSIASYVDAQECAMFERY